MAKASPRRQDLGKGLQAVRDSRVKDVPGRANSLRKGPKTGDYLDGRGASLLSTAGPRVDAAERAQRGRGPSEREWGDMIPGPFRPWQGLHRGALNTEVMSSHL